MSPSPCRSRSAQINTAAAGGGWDRRRGRELGRATRERLGLRPLRAVPPAGDGAAKTKGAGAAARQGGVAPEPTEASLGHYGAAAGKKGGAGAALVSTAPPSAVWGPTRKTKKGGVAAMGTITEDEACEFGPDGVCAVVSSLKLPRRAGFGATSDGVVFAR